MRRDMVTRTVLGTEVTVKVVDTENDTIITETVKLGKAYDKEDPKLEKVVRKTLPANRVLVSITEVAPLSKLYGLDTAKFMELAMELDPETRKPLTAETQTEEAE